MAVTQAGIHPEEDERLKSLYRLQALDTSTEQQFDDITELAAYICGTPISLVSLVDKDRQFFKSHYGTDVCETDLSRSVCAFTMLSREPLQIEDTATDPRTADNPLVRGELLMRFYAGAPLIGRDGYAYGALCVLDTRPRRLDAAQMKALERLAGQVVHLLEFSVIVREREEALGQAETLKAEIDHRVANSLQQVAVLLRLQTRGIKDEGAREALEQAQQRIKAIASFHRTVSAISDGQVVSLPRLMTLMSDDLGGMLPDTIELVQEMPDITVAARFATGLALIVNEFLANSLKYAFSDGRPGKIRLSGSLDGDTVTLVFADNGVGWNGDLPESQSTGIGMRVIEASVETLSGTMEMSGEGGCTLTVTFPLSAVRPE